MAAKVPVVIALDVGTTGVRSIAFDTLGQMVCSSYRELTQYFPRPGWVEHDAGEIWTLAQATLAEVVRTLPESMAVVAVGITNQRETVVAWNLRTGEPKQRAIVWQDRRTAETCTELSNSGYLPLIRARTGLVLDPYFSASKAQWMFRHTDLSPSGDLALGTVDDWLVWNLTGQHSTDPSNASRTMLYDIVEGKWSAELCELFQIPPSCLAQVNPSSARIGLIGDGPLMGVPVSGVLGDQQAALLGQACLAPGFAKCTYGTGSFVLLNVGVECPQPVDGLLTTIAWQLGAGQPPTYALEGAVFVTGAAIQWLRDSLGIIEHAAEIGPLAETVPSTDGVYFVPALAGLGSPWWDPYARGTIVGLAKGIGRAHLARAVVESIAFQVRDVVDAMIAGSNVGLDQLRVDGGASVMNLLLQLQADQIGVPVSRPVVTDTTAFGAAIAAGLAEGVWPSVDAASVARREDVRVLPHLSRADADRTFRDWHRAVERSRSWASQASSAPTTPSSAPAATA